jgi:galactokinase
LLYLITFFLGGCTVTLVKQSSVDKCIAAIKKGYKGTASFYEFKPSDGARSIDLK